MIYANGSQNVTISYPSTPLSIENHSTSLTVAKLIDEQAKDKHCRSAAVQVEKLIT